MTNTEVRASRLLNQQLSQTKFKEPKEIVSWMGAMQAQEYAMAKWAIRLRLPGSTDDDIEIAINKGEILRTHLLRPTWHFVSPEDIRWMLALTAPRINAASSFMYRKLDLGDVVFGRSNEVIAKALQGGKHLTRTVLQYILEENGIPAEGLRLGYLMMYAELAGVICSGARKGNQFTYALLEERVPAVKSLSREQSVAELCKRYFTSRGPATLKDFITWSGLTMKDAKDGIEAIGPSLHSEKIDGDQYFFTEGIPLDKTKQATFLMPDYDEYGMSYKNRSAINYESDLEAHKKAGYAIYDRMLIVDGKVAGTWKRTIKGKTADIEIVTFEKIKKSTEVLNAAKKFSEFVGKELVMNGIRIL